MNELRYVPCFQAIFYDIMGGCMLSPWEIKFPIFSGYLMQGIKEDKTWRIIRFLFTIAAKIRSLCVISFTYPISKTSTSLKYNRFVQKCGLNRIYRFIAVIISRLLGFSTKNSFILIERFKIYQQTGPMI